MITSTCRRALVVAATASAVGLLAACSSLGSATATSTLPATTTSTVDATSSTTAFTKLTSPTNISIPTPACKLAIQGAPVATGSVNVVLTSQLPLEVAQINYKYGIVARRFTMKTDGNGAASHPLPIPRQAAGLQVSVTATLAATNAACSTNFIVP